MKKILLAIALFLIPSLALAQSQRNPCFYTTASPGPGNGCNPVSSASPLPVVNSATQTISGAVTTSPYPTGSTAITGNATGSTGAVVGTLAANATLKTYICGLAVSAIGGTATVGPITVAGLVGSSQVYQVPVNSATNATVLGPFNFNPCIPSSAINTAITVTTTADGTATAVDVNSWGYQAP